MNEVVVYGFWWGYGGGVDLEVCVDGLLYFGSYVDGVFVMMFVGSFVYNFSEGGLFVYFGVEGFVVIEMVVDEGMLLLVVF